MNSFWPEGLEFEDIQTPDKILETAREEWETKSEGTLTLVFQRAKSQGNLEMIIVYAKHIHKDLTATLFTVVHRPNSPYPVTIVPNEEDLPNALKKSYYKPGFGSIVLGTTGEHVENEWVSDLPAEFRKKLAEAFNLSSVKTSILSLASQCISQQIESKNNEQAKGKPRKKK